LPSAYRGDEVLTFRNAVLATVGAVVLGLSGVAAAPAFASDPVVPPAPIPTCKDADPAAVACLTVGELGEDGVQTRVKVEEILCVKADVLMEKEGRADRSISETLDAKIYIPCKAPRVAEFENCDEAAKVGAYDIPRSDPRYQRKLDDDKDGIACESVIESDNKDVTPAPKPDTVESDLPVTH
jgi:hypothetical protein